MKMEKILSELKRQYNIVCEEIPECRIIGIFLRGSQNYGLANENSDVDSVVLVFPSRKDFIMNREAINYTIDDEDNKIQVLDIRLFFNQLRKSSPNCLELMFTKYYHLNLDYHSFWENIVSKREEIAYLDKNRLMQSLRGFVCTNMKQFKNVADKQHKKGYQVLRIWEQVCGIVNGKTYEESLQSKFIVTKMLKNKEIPADDFVLEFGELACTKIDNLTPYETKDKDVLDALQSGIMLAYIRRVF